MFRFESLQIWQEAISYGKELYKLSDKFPKEETFALKDQLRRAAVSVSNNIAEGSGGTKKDFASFLNISIKSTLETVNILYFAKEMGYVNESERVKFYEQAEVLIRKIRAFKNKILIPE
jgi:four helix bundle protein